MGKQGQALRVLHVAQPVVDGVAVVVADLAEYLSQRGDDTVVACPPRGYLSDRLRDAGIPLVPWEASREPGRSTLAETRALSRVTADVNPSVVHLHSSKAGLAGRLAIRGRRPTVFSPHAWSFYHLEGAMRTAALTWERVASRWCDVILCGSTEEAQAGLDLGIAGRYEVIPNSSRMRDPGLSRAQARRELELPVGDDVPLAICLGRFTRQKGQDIMLSAWPTIRKAVPGARLALAGQGDDDQKLRDLADPDVIFGPIPHRDLAAVWMLASDVMVFPSRWETLSLAVLEALQLGRPVVVSDCGGMREALAGGVGTMVPAENPAALAQAVVPYLADRGFAAREGESAEVAYREIHQPEREAKLARYRRLLADLGS